MDNRTHIFTILIIFLCLFCPVSLIPAELIGKEFPGFSNICVKADENLIPDIIGVSMKLPDIVYAGTYLRVIDIVRSQEKLPTGTFSINYILEDSNGIQPERLLGTINIQNLVRGGQKKINTTFPVPSDVQTGHYLVQRLITNTENSANTGSYLQGRQNQVQIINSEENILTGYSDDPEYTGETGTLFISSTVVNSNDYYPVETKIFYYLSKSGLISDDLIFIGDTNNFIIQPKDEIITEKTFSISEELVNGKYFLISSFLPIEIITKDNSSYWISGDPVSISRTIPYNYPVIPLTRPDTIQTSPEPDVTTLKTDYPDILYIGEGNKITDSIANIGGSTAGIVRVEYLFSSDNAGSDAKHLDWWTIHNLKGGETRTEQVTIGIPGGIRAGIYYLTKKITVTSSPQEKNTANNFWTGNRPVRAEYNPAARIPDLTHVTTKFPFADPGENAEISDTITNIGNACAGQVTVAYYISPYPSFDPSTARYLGAWETGRICVGEQLSNTINITIPADLRKGEYYWFSVIDPCTFIAYCGEEMPELDKSNNINIGQLNIGPCVFCR